MILPFELDLNGPWQTSLRRGWFANYLWDMQKRGNIKNFGWASNEKRFYEPMTRPPLSEDQVAVMDSDYLSYLELLGRKTTVHEYIQQKLDS